MCICSCVHSGQFRIMHVRVGQHHVLLSMMFPDKCSYRYTVHVFSPVLYTGCCERVGITASTGDEQGRS